MTSPRTELPRTIPTWPARSVLLTFIRAHAPDIRILKARLADGRRACGARFTFRGEAIEVEAIATDALDADDAIVRRAAWVIYHRLGIPTHIENAKAVRLQQEILAARQMGDATLADQLGLELVLFNEGKSGVVKMRTRFEQ